jgi:hypothetical protein
MPKRLLSWDDARRRGLCCWCAKTWTPGHKCPESQLPIENPRNVQITKVPPGEAELHEEISDWAKRRTKKGL